MILKEIKLGEDTNSKRKAILENEREQVILHDFSDGWIHGLLLKELSPDTYLIHIADERDQEILLYQNLQQLILLKPHKDYPLPEIKNSPLPKIEYSPLSKIK